MNIIVKYISCLIMIGVLNVSSQSYDLEKLGGWAISKEVFEYILDTLPVGSTILELGSGVGTGELAKYYKMFSIEDNKAWLNKYQSTYIYAPIKNYGSYRWYDVEYLSGNLPQKYDLIFIDGPFGGIGRFGFYHHMSLFDINVPILFDDTNRNAERDLFNAVASVLNRPTLEIRSADKVCSVILPASNQD